MSVVRVFFCVLLAGLAACDSDKPAAPEAPREALREESAAPLPAPPPVTAPAPVEPAPAEAPEKSPAAPAEPARPAVAAVRPPRPAAAARVEKPLPLAPLDLSVPGELLERLPGEDGLPLTEPQPLLPPLFGDKVEQPQSFELGGRLITNEREADEDSWHAVEGAELELRFRR
ncbi:hypothetical protein OF001_U310039 [Pseudomonas sp. OF001]|uniref:hypothetical protein n=1 Tax=Pseudomonas sp. OF001 TaxID=2772300 RepID=UPI0019959BDC|nr:hypothetical protein [Pseudomonas sp. OF001]CAD5378586.1 hypothetical protein OF001_U310039 [Pseudomonas sp. OF001]